MKILIVSQTTGSHGWSSFEAYISGIKSLKINYDVCQPRCQWGDNVLENDDNFLTKVESLKAEDVLLLCGFDWHSQVLHSNKYYRDCLIQCPAKKVGIFQEHLTADWITSNDKIKSEFERAIKSAVGCLTHMVCNHEQDVEYVSNFIAENQSVIFLPFFADLSVFNNKNMKRKNKGFFRGKQSKLLDSDPYYKRNAIINILRSHSDFEFLDFETSKFGNAKEMVTAYCDDLNRYEVQLNLPSLSRSLTCRPFEIGATGGCLISEKCSGLVSQGIFTDSEANLLDPFSAKTLEKIMSELKVDEKKRERQKERLYSVVESKHSHYIRLSQLINWINSDASIFDIHSSLINDGCKSKILIDLVFFQYANSGIARVWLSILNQIAESGLSEKFILLRRKGTKTDFSNTIKKSFHILDIDAHSYQDRERDRTLLNYIYKLYEAEGFISTYFTYTNYKNSLLLHDFIPEIIDSDCFSDEMWLEKREAIRNSSSLFTISDSTAKDLLQYYPEVVDVPVYSAYNKAENYLPEVTNKDADALRYKLGLNANVILVVGERIGYKGYKNIPHGLAALQQYISDNGLCPGDFSVLCVGGGEYENKFTLEPDVEKNLYGLHVVRARLNDKELAAAYKLSSLLLYPSTIEGFGLPPIEAAHFGTPSLLVDNNINREIWGDNFPMASSGDIKNLKSAIAYSLDSNNLCQKSIEYFVNKKLPILKCRGDNQGLRIAENLLLQSDKLCSRHILAHPTQISQWRNRLSEYNFYRINETDYHTNEYKVTAILSVYKAEKFISHCLKNLVDQSLFKAGQMEIIIIDSASPQSEKEIIKSYINTYKNIFYYRTPTRETLYLAWSRACKLARGKYITNTNSDDRHREDFMESLSEFLDNKPMVQLTYPQQYITFKENEDFTDHEPKRIWGWPDYTLEQLKIGNHVGSQPMWRRSVHGKVGYFQTNYTCAGDYEFWLRIATNVGPLELYPVPIGTYYFNPVGIEHGDPLQSKLEMDEICEKYKIVKNYEVSETDTTDNGDGRSFDSLQYNGVELKNDVTVMLQVDDIILLRSSLRNIEKQSLFKDHIYRILIVVPKDRKAESRAYEYEISLCKTRQIYENDLSIVNGCLLKVSFNKKVELDVNLLRNFVSELYNSTPDKKILEISGMKIEGVKNV